MAETFRLAIGALVIELIGAWIGLDAAIDDDPGTTPASRAFEAADSLCSDRQLEAVTESVLSLDPDQSPLPASLGRVCHRCGCSEHARYDQEDRACRSPISAAPAGLRDCRARSDGL